MVFRNHERKKQDQVGDYTRLVNYRYLTKRVELFSFRYLRPYRSTVEYFKEVSEFVKTLPLEFI